MHGPEASGPHELLNLPGGDPGLPEKGEEARRLARFDDHAPAAFPEDAGRFTQALRAAIVRDARERMTHSDHVEASTFEWQLVERGGCRLEERALLLRRRRRFAGELGRLVDRTRAPGEPWLPGELRDDPRIRTPDHEQAISEACSGHGDHQRFTRFALAQHEHEPMI